MRRILIGLAAVIALGLCTMPAMAGEFRHERDHRTVVRVEHRDVRRHVERRDFHRGAPVRHDHVKVVRKVYRR